MVTEIKLVIDKSILSTLNKSNEEFKRDILFNNASTLYRKGKLSLLEAAELAGYDRINFIEILINESNQRLENDEITNVDFLENLREALRL